MAQASRHGRRATAVAFGGVALAIVVYFIRTRRLGLGYPVPWSDESSFLWPALAFRDTWSLFAPEMNPHRDLFWMPPGFMLLHGLLLKVMAFSLSRARCVSALCMSGAFAFAFGCVARSRARLAHSCVIAAFTFCPVFLLVGNVARMESLVLLLGAAGFFLLTRGRVAGLGLLALAPLVHPNGLFLLLAGVVYGVAARRERRPMNGVDVLVLCAAVAAWAAYAGYAGTHFAAFRIDMGNQLRAKRGMSALDGGPLARASHAVVYVPALALLVALFAARRVGARVFALGALAASLFVQTAATVGWLYESYTAFAILVTAFVVIEVVSATVEGWGPRRRAAALAVSGLAFALGVLGFVDRDGYLSRSVDRATVARTGHLAVYATDEDVAVVSAGLRDLGRREPSSIVQFVPAGEALLFEGARSKALRYTQPTFLRYRPSAVIYHDSAWLPRLVAGYELFGVLIPNKVLGTPVQTTLRTRGTEKWVLYTWPRSRGDSSSRPRFGSVY